MERTWHHLVQRQMGLLKDFAEIFDKIPLAENREDEVCKLTVSMDPIVDIGTTGNDEVESLRWEGHSSRMDKRTSILKYLNP